MLRLAGKKKVQKTTSNVAHAQGANKKSMYTTFDMWDATGRESLMRRPLGCGPLRTNAAQTTGRGNELTTMHAGLDGVKSLTSYTILVFLAHNSCRAAILLFCCFQGVFHFSWTWASLVVLPSHDSQVRAVGHMW